MLVNIRPVESTLWEGDVGVANNVGVKSQLDYKPKIRMRKEAESNLGITWCHVSWVWSGVWRQSCGSIRLHCQSTNQLLKQAWLCYSCQVQKCATSETTSTE